MPTLPTNFFLLRCPAKLISFRNNQNVVETGFNAFGNIRIVTVCFHSIPNASVQKKHSWQPKQEKRNSVRYKESYISGGHPQRTAAQYSPDSSDPQGYPSQDSHSSTASTRPTLQDRHYRTVITWRCLHRTATRGQPPQDSHHRTATKRIAVLCRDNNHRAAATLQPR